MANITLLMIGVRNNDTILNRTRCAEIWVNELRLSGFDRQGGWASTVSLNMKLADLGNISLSGGYSTPGWGSIDQKLELEKGEYKTYLLDVTPEKQTSRSINFSNVKKMRTGSKKKRFYDIENFDATFAYNENKKKDINTEFDIVQNYKGGFNYNFNHQPKSLKPLKKPIINAVEKQHMAKLVKEEKGLLDSLKAIRGAKTSSSQIKIIQT